MDGKLPAQRIAMKAVIERDGKLLLLREAPTYSDGNNTGRYHFPGGRIEAGEPFQDGLRREVREETGLEVTIGQPLFVGEWFPDIKGVKTQIVAVFIICQPVSDQEIVLSDEHDQFVWATLDEIAQLDTMPPDDEVARAYFK